MAFTKITTNVVEDQAITADKIDISTLPPAGVVVTNNTEDGDITVTGDVEGSSLTITGSAGPMVWNSDEETLDIPLNSEVTLQAGQESVFRVKATEAISNGEVVMFAGAQGDHILAARADVNATGFRKEWIIGIATQDFLINEFGFVTDLGKVRGLDTSGFSEGDLLWLNGDSPGILVNVEPAAPNHGVLLASVLRSHQNEGTLFVRPTFKSEFGELCDTDFSTLSDNEIVAYDASSGTWVNRILDAADVDYDNTVSGISANTVQEAIDYLNTLSGGSSGDVASYTRQKFVATEGQTTFTVTDGYTLGYLEVYFNGVLLDTTDYTANDESTVVLSVAASAGDEIATIAHDSFAIAELLRTTSISASAPDDAITIDANGGLLVGTTASAGVGVGNTDTGHVFGVDGWVTHSRSSDTPLYLNRNTSSGPIIDLRYNGGPIGTIGSVANVSTYIHGRTGYSGLTFGLGEILPCDESGATRTSAIDLGDSTGLFKDLYLSGGINPITSVTGNQFTQPNDGDDAITAGWISSTFGKDSAKVVIGVHSGNPTIGAHNNALNAWDDLHLQASQIKIIRDDGAEIARFDGSRQFGLGATVAYGQQHTYSSVAQVNNLTATSMPNGGSTSSLILEKRHSLTKDTDLLGFPAASLELRANNTVYRWITGQILGLVDPNNSNNYAGGMAFFTQPGGTAANTSNGVDQGVNPELTMLMDNAGNVITPRSAKFLATNTANPNLVNGVIVNSTANINIGSHYNTSNGRFTAPIRGVYQFSFSGQAYNVPPATRIIIYLRKNGVQYPINNSAGGMMIIYDKDDLTLSDHDTRSMTGLVEMARGDYVEVYVEGGIRGMQSHFSGHLIG